MKKTRVMIVAGEASGDLHGGNLARALLAQRPGIELFGIGGENMRAAGVDTLVDNREIAVVGIWEVLSHFGVIKAAFDRMKRILEDDPPELVILIDYPDFNLRLAKIARKAGVRVVYYISPQVWAWRRGRVKKMAGLIDKMLVAFQFEEKFYKDAGIDCAFVGHPLLDAVGETPGREELASRLGLDPERPVAGLLPGSRKKELSFHLPVILESYRLLKDKMPDVQGVIPVAGTLARSDFRPYMQGFEDVRLVERDTAGVMGLMDAAVVVSGTATLQTALYGKPMVIIYRLSRLTYMIGRMMIKLKNIGLVNLVAGREVVPELVQYDATPEKISSLIFKMFCDKAYYDGIKTELDMVREKLGGGGASARAAGEVLRLLD
ncbi:MAG TPA: lipid-A-disaccharide synthase [Nitrospirota bacterium]